jgi:hypothetical protein
MLPLLNVSAALIIINLSDGYYVIITGICHDGYDVSRNNKITFRHWCISSNICRVDYTEERNNGARYIMTPLCLDGFLAHKST